MSGFEQWKREQFNLYFHDHYEKMKRVVLQATLDGSSLPGFDNPLQQAYQILEHEKRAVSLSNIALPPKTNPNWTSFFHITKANNSAEKKEEIIAKVDSPTKSK